MHWQMRCATFFIITQLKRSKIPQILNIEVTGKMTFRDEVMREKKKIDDRGTLEQVQNRVANQMALSLAEAIRNRLLLVVKKQYSHGQRTSLNYRGYMLIHDFQKNLFLEDTVIENRTFFNSQTVNINVSTLASYALLQLQSELSSDDILIGPYLFVSKPYFLDDDDSKDSCHYETDVDDHIKISIYYTFVDNISMANYTSIEKFPRLPLPVSYMPGGDTIRIIKDGRNVYKGSRSSQGETVAVEIAAEL